MIETVAATVIRMAEERMKKEPFQNRNSAIHAVMMDLVKLIMIEMAKGKAAR